MSAKPKAFIPRVKVLDRAMISRIIDEAFEILAKVGDMIENEEALQLLGDHGAQVDLGSQRAFLPRDLVERALKSAPRQFKLWDLTGKQSVTVGGDHVLYDPGSAARASARLYMVSIESRSAPAAASASACSL